jgi:AcrR family transcriptional regulator
MPVKPQTPSGGAKALNGHSYPDGHARSGASRQVAELQRARMLTAMVQEISERGAANVSVGHVVGRSGVSRRTFYEVFHDREDCFLAAFDDALKSVAAVVLAAYGAPGLWRVKLRAGLVALLECLECDRATARLLIVESLAAGPKALGRRRDVVARIIPVLEQGATEGRTPDPSPGLTAEGVIGGVLSVLHSRLVAEDSGDLLDLAGPLMGMVVLPYLGPAAARREIDKPVPKRPGNRRLVIRADPLQDLPMRLTYRTIRVLTAVAELGGPGSYPSNRAVGEHAGIADQGQASKLLARLHKLGLIENQGGDPTRGEPNAWTLTTTGQQVHNTITGLGG